MNSTLLGDSIFMSQNSENNSQGNQGNQGGNQQPIPTNPNAPKPAKRPPSTPVPPPSAFGDTRLDGYGGGSDSIEKNNS